MIWLAIGIACAGAGLLLVAGERLRRRRDEAQAWLRGVRYVLSDNPDAAIEALSSVARLGGPEALETYMALAALFRRTGELSRAIRIHQNLLLAPGLSPEARREAERELGYDFRKAGMLEEAAKAFRGLASAGDAAAAEGLRDVLMEKGDVAGAAEVQKRLGKKDDPLLAHLLAAAARELLARGDALQARVTAVEGIAADGKNADALLAAAEAAAALGDSPAALEAIEQALAADPASTDLAWPALRAVPDRAAAERVLAELAIRRRSAGLHALRARFLRAAGREPEMLGELREALALDGPDGSAVRAVRELLGGDAEKAKQSANVEASHALLLAALSRPVSALRCARCGAESPSRVWRCPACGAFWKREAAARAD